MAVLNQNNQAVTLIEVLVVVVLMGIIAGFGMTGYYKSQERAHLSTAETQLTMLAKAQAMYFVRQETYYPPSGWGTVDDSDMIEDALHVFLPESGFDYWCEDTLDEATYRCVAQRQGQPVSGQAYEVVLERDSDGNETLECRDGTVKACP